MYQYNSLLSGSWSKMPSELRLTPCFSVSKTMDPIISKLTKNLDGETATVITDNCSMENLTDVASVTPKGGA